MKLLLETYLQSEREKIMQAPDEYLFLFMADLPFFFAIIAQFAQLVVVCTNHHIIAHHNYSQFLSKSVFI